MRKKISCNQRATRNPCCTFLHMGCNWTLVTHGVQLSPQLQIVAYRMQLTLNCTQLRSGCNLTPQLQIVAHGLQLLP